MISYWSQPQAAIQTTAVIGTSKVSSKNWTQINLVISKEKGSRLFMYSEAILGLLGGSFKVKPYTDCTHHVSTGGHLGKEEFGDRTEGIDAVNAHHDLPNRIEPSEF